MAAAKKREKQAKRANQRARRRHRKMMAAAGAMLLVPAVVSSEPAAVTNPANLAALDGVGGGLMGLTDPDSVSADGTLSQDDQIGADVLRDAGNPAQLGLGEFDLPSGPLGIPGVMLEAYKRAEATLAKSQPNCHLSWSLLASIGRIESSHGRGGQTFANGDTLNPILGPVLNGGGFRAIADTDAGRYDGDSRWDRAVGAMQFIPSTWATYASDGNGDRISSPHNVFDASLAAGKYLCSGGMDLSNPQQRAAAVFRYNQSDTYVRVVLIWADAYLNGVTAIPSTPLPAVPPMVQAVARGEDPATTPPATTPPPSDTPSVTLTPIPPTSSTTTTTTPSCPTSPPPTSPPTSTSTSTTTPTTTPGCPTTPTSTSSSTTTSTTTPPSSSTSTNSDNSSTSSSVTTTTTPPAAPSSSSSTNAETTSSETTSPVGP